MKQQHKTTSGSKVISQEIRRVATGRKAVKAKQTSTRSYKRRGSARGVNRQAGDYALHFSAQGRGATKESTTRTFRAPKGTSGWFRMDVPEINAMESLTGEADGTFVVRGPQPVKGSNHFATLTYMHDQVLSHVPILSEHGKYWLAENPSLQFFDIVELVVRSKLPKSNTLLTDQLDGIFTRSALLEVPLSSPITPKV